jgi:fumarate reductase flavoprotein subunit
MLVDMTLKTRKEFASEGFIIGYRLSPEELEEPGITLRDTSKLIEELSKRKIDYIHLSLSSYKQSSLRDTSSKEPIINFLKKFNINNIPLIGVGGIETKEEVLEALDMGFDLVAIGKAALSDASIVTNILNNKPIKKIIDEDSHLPTNMKKRISEWSYLKDKGYTVK